MLVRVNDVVVGMIAGAVCAVLAAAFEAGIVALRYFSIGHVGGLVADSFALLALVGAVLGALVGLSVGAVFPWQKSPSRVRIR